MNVLEYASFIKKVKIEEGNLDDWSLEKYVAIGVILKIYSTVKEKDIIDSSQDKININKIKDIPSCSDFGHLKNESFMIYNIFKDYSNSKLLGFCFDLLNIDVIGSVIYFNIDKDLILSLKNMKFFDNLEESYLKEKDNV